MSAFDPYQIRSDFPILSQEINGKPLVYLDNAATSQKPLSVLDSSRDYYEKINSNIHRGVHKLSQAATAAHETARDTIARHLNATRPEEIIFTSGTTDSINLVASALGRSDLLKAGEEIIISGLEHHSNTVPWQMLCERLGITLKIIPVLDDGTLDLEIFDQLLSEKTKLVSVNHVSNAFGTVNNIAHICSQAKKVGALTFVDGAQSVPHFSIDLQLLDCDFYAFSGHKVYGPTGVGVLFGKYDLLCELPPWRGGGEMIKEVTFEKTTYNEPPFKFEAGTPNIAGVVGLKTALNYVNSIGIERISEIEDELLKYAQESISKINNLNIFGNAQNKASVISFTVDGIHPFDIGTLLDQSGIAIRTGHHCTQPLMKFFNISGTARASFAFYNNKSEIDFFIYALKNTIKMLS